MSLTQGQVAVLEKAMCNYCFPKVTYDFQNGIEVNHQTMRSVESTIYRRLISRGSDDVKDGLSNVLYWGYRRTGYRWTRVNEFRKEVTYQQLQRAVRVFKDLKGVGLRTLKKLELPQFSYVSFLSKLRMFLDPRNFVTLDRKLMKLAQASPETLLSFITQYETYIPATYRNEKYYLEWCDLCRKAAQNYFGGKNIPAVDVERGIFQLVDDKQLTTAANIIKNI